MLTVKPAACRKSRVGRANDVARQVLVGSRCKMETVETAWCVPVRHPSAQSTQSLPGTKETRQQPEPELGAIHSRRTFDLRHAAGFTVNISSLELSKHFLLACHGN